MKTFYIFIFAIFVALGSSAQKQLKAHSTYKITYARSVDGVSNADRNPIIVIVAEKQNLLTTQKIFTQSDAYPFEESIVIKPANKVFQIAYLKTDNQISTADTSTINNQVFEYSNERKVILGYNCKKAKTVVNSNTIELWYTTDVNIKAAPTVLGQNLGLVLEQVRNGNSYLTATKIDEIKNNRQRDVSNLKLTDALSYKDLLWKNRFTTLPLFNQEIINFTDKPQSNDSIFRYAGGTVIARKVKFPQIQAGSNVFIDLTEQSNGDAYDRTGSVFIIPTDKTLSLLNALQTSVKMLPTYENGNGKIYQGVAATPNYNPPIELMRFFTPFGVGKYNTLKLKDKIWGDQVHYRQDISEMFSLINDQEVWVAVFIGNYDKGGHKVSANITIHNGVKKDMEKSVVRPLFNSTNVMEMAGQEYPTMFNVEKGLQLSFTLGKDLKDATLRYITTGHGGWSGGDEFVPRKNTIWIDDKEVFSFVPWRMDCGSYRLSNPASGNFENGLSSSDLSRSNWCPGTVTNPNLISLGDLKAGEHTIKVAIPMGPPQGTSSSAWNVSGVLLGKE